MPGEGGDDVAFGQDAIDPLAIVADDKRADMLAIEAVNSLRDRRAGGDGRDPIALVAQDLLDIHWACLQSGAAAARRSGAKRPRSGPQDMTECRTLKGASGGRWWAARRIRVTCRPVYGTSQEHFYQGQSGARTLDVAAGLPR